ncbi:iron complex transport system permease protein [Neorhizobium huautlense]|uniref:Iron complex transport system permease protein n=1 Tax=Neorhizobium huautlense TaxID=67774 RepID=A0ABT9PPZ5_9HYPH|nr:iron chelate uptake ABC transporter family permease subunit [Neorhizobium huautlense]MDP9836548.1 iron complex transport system permease protein [Neorhizobium huautlense]
MIALTFRNPATLPILASIMLTLLCLISLGVGAGGTSLADLWHASGDTEILAISRLPRTLAAVLAGAGLAIAGLIMQAIARNRFVEPATAGTAQSAELGILLVTILWPAAALGWKALAASLAAVTGTALFLMTAHRLPATQPYLVPLFGLVYGGVIGAAATFIAWQTDLLQYLSVWSNGDFSGVLRGRYELLWLGAILVAVAWLIADRLTIMALGRETSIGLGIDYARMLQIGLVIIAVISAVTVVVIGIIPFVGLVVPNLVSRLMGDNMRATLPATALSGAILVLGCDILGRLIRFPYEIPVGTVMGVVGAILFLFLLFRRHTDA